MQLPAAYADLAKEPGPVMLLKALELYGTVETPGSADNPVIIGWAKELGLSKVYSDDAIPWCGLFVAICAKRAGWDAAPGGNALWARNWAKWGNPSPDNRAELGDVLVFVRDGGGHVGLYVGEDNTTYHVLGGNQSDKVCITRIDRMRCIARRRAPWRIAQPANVRRIIRAASGAISTNEK